MTESASAPTLSQVAEHAGVSLATASRALNGSTRKVNAELSERVLAAARALGYSPNVQAQAVARGTSNTVAIVVGDIADPYFSAIASGAIRVADERGLVVTMAATGSDARREAATLAALKGQKPRAVILAGSRHVGGDADSASVRELDAIRRGGGRVTLIGSDFARPGPAGSRVGGAGTSGSDEAGFRSVVVRHSEGAAALAAALIDLGYTDFAILAGSDDLLTPRERTTGFAEAASARGVSIHSDRVVHSAFSRDGGHAAMSALLAEGARPQCVFAVTDVMALGAMTALREAGLTPGEDVAVAGFDDIALARDVTPTLTTVALPLAEIGARALEIALADEPDGTLDAPFDGAIVLRDSTPRVALAAIL